MNSAFILIDKQPGITSFKALNVIKKQFATKRVGHAGTLDLAASGLIVAAMGKCTRLLPYIEAKEKTYTFDLHLGILTDTLEPTGNIIKKDDNFCIDNLNSVLQTFIGEIEQVPPAYSAIKINGKRASDLALKGEDVELKPRTIFIYELYLKGGMSIYCKCSKGTYIRSLARDIAERLGTCGVAGNIRRLAIGNISVEQACDEPILPNKLLNWETINIDEEQTKKILNGVPISLNPVNSDNSVNPGSDIFLANNEQIIAVAEYQNGYLIPKFQL